MKRITFFAAGLVLAAQLGFAQSAESVESTATPEKKTEVKETTATEVKTISEAAPVTRSDRPIKSETILDRQRRNDGRVSKREPKK